MRFDKVIAKIEGCNFLASQCCTITKDQPVYVLLTACGG